MPTETPPDQEAPILICCHPRWRDKDWLLLLLSQKGKRIGFDEATTINFTCKMEKKSFEKVNYVLG